MKLPICDTILVMLAEALHVLFIVLACFIGGTAALAILYGIYEALILEPRREREWQRKADELKARYAVLEYKGDSRTAEEEQEFQMLMWSPYLNPWMREEPRGARSRSYVSQ
ncbi:MAG: hypothetical protein QUS09_03495 [Methanotrichaceae archaeon]|nr:hypothetical protein [Methanotrichaceae archaeon]